MSSSVAINSALCVGRVFHQRYQPTGHGFDYPLYMLLLDLDELEPLEASLKLFSSRRFAPFRFRREDHFGDPTLPLKQTVLDKVSELGGDSAGIERVEMLGQLRCFGLYFSPVNFFFCYRHGAPHYMLAEVSNTPWNETHCYLVDLQQPAPTEKRFHVSPFMDLDMRYHWRVELNRQKLLVHIENWRDAKLFDATLTLQPQPLTNRSLLKVLKQWPMMTFSILRAIYWQALRLLIKRVPYHSHP